MADEIVPNPERPSDIPRVDNPFQQRVMELRTMGYDWNQINGAISERINALKAAGYTDEQIEAATGVKNDPAVDSGLYKTVKTRINENPPVAAAGSDPVKTYFNTLLNYSSIGELLHVTPPEQPPPEAGGIWDRLAQSLGIITGSFPYMWAGARIGAVAGAGFSGVGAGPGAVIGATGGLFVDAYIRATYSDAMINGSVKGPQDYATRVIQNTWSALAEAAPAGLAMAVGPMARGFVMARGFGPVAGTFAQGGAELTAMTAAASAIQQRLPTWEEVIDNAILLSAMHAASKVPAGFDKAKNALKAYVPSPSEISSASKALLKNWATTGERPNEAVQRVYKDTSLDGLSKRLQTLDGVPSPEKGVEIQDGWDRLNLEKQTPALRARAFDSLNDSGFELTKRFLERSKGDADKFNDLRREHLQEDFARDPAKYGGNLEEYLTRMDTRPPMSPEEGYTERLRAQGKDVPPDIALRSIEPQKNGILSETGRIAKQIFNPENVDANAQQAVAIIRENTGVGSRATAQAGASITNKMRRGLNSQTSVTPFIDYIENRSSGAKLPKGAEHLQRAADTLRDIVDLRRKALEASPSTEDMSFVEDYFPHLWKNPEQARAFLFSRGGKQGSTKNLKARTYPTVAEGMEAGLEPRLDPISAVMEYTANMDKVIALNAIRDEGVANGDITYRPLGKQLPGEVALNGRLGQKFTPAGILQAYAPEGFARIYNNFVSRGFGELSPDIGRAYTLVQQGFNMITALKLTLSGYHAVTMTFESVVNGMAQGIDEMIAGHPVRGVASALLAPLRPIKGSLKGRQLEHVYLGKEPGSQLDQQIVDLITEAGGRMSGATHATDYSFSQLGSYFTSAFRGTLIPELKADVRAIAERPLAGTAEVVYRNIGRAMQTVAQPLFEKYIPWLKNAATYEHLASWLVTHPEATRAEALKAARYIVDRVDDRFGEMVQDNVFMNKFVKQTAMLSMLSWSWTFGGDIRALGGGAVDTIKAVGKISAGDKLSDAWTPKISYLIALPVTMAGFSAVYQYLKTGEWPVDLRDLLAPRTGGVINGQPERALPPGFMKDVYAFLDHPVEEVKNKMSPALKEIGELLTNTDWRGDPIRSPVTTGTWVDSVPNWMKEYWDYILKTNEPIAFSNIREHKIGTGFNRVEEILGFRQAPANIADPEGHENLMRYLGTREWYLKLLHDAKAASQRESGLDEPAAEE